MRLTMCVLARRYSLVLFCLCACIACCAAGCASPTLVDALELVAQRQGVADASTLPVAGRGHLRFTLALKSDLADALEAKDSVTLKARGGDVLREAGRIAVTTGRNEIERMPEVGLRELAGRDGGGDAGQDPALLRAQLQHTFEEHCQQAIDADVGRLQSASAADAKLQLAGILRDIRPPAGERGKLVRVLAGSPLLVPAAIGARAADDKATQRSLAADFRAARLYRPAQDTHFSDVAGESVPIETLARRYAPLIVQEHDPEAGYPPSDDEFGQVGLSGDATAITVHIDVARPVVYWTHAEAKIHNRRYVQLVYVLWYPSRPALSTNDPEAGKIDGAILRVTLDRANRPAVYEFVRSCGCYHTLWVASYLEDAARAEFGPPQESEQFAIRRPHARGLFLPALIADAGDRPVRPTVYLSAGEHLVVSIRAGEPAGLPQQVGPTATYALEPYASLTRLPLGDGVASMFGSDGLVHNAGRAEGWLLSPTGMLSAGQPRQLGTMKIRMDAYDYDDPRLLEQNLRLPASF